MLDLEHFGGVTIPWDTVTPLSFSLDHVSSSFDVSVLPVVERTRRLLATAPQCYSKKPAV